MTVRDLIKRSLRMIGQLRPGRDSGASETADALVVLNSYIEWLRTDKLNITALEIFEVTLTAAGRYTIGAGGDFDRVRPVRIERAALLADPRTELEVLVRDQWVEGRSCGLYYDPQYPLGVLYLFPDPGGTLELHAWSYLSSFASDAEVIDLAPGYTEFLAYNLAVRLGAEWGAAVPPMVLNLAISTLAEVRSLNLLTPIMRCDPAVTSRGFFDVIGGGYSGTGPWTWP